MRLIKHLRRNPRAAVRYYLRCYKKNGILTKGILVQLIDYVKKRNFTTPTITVVPTTDKIDITIIHLLPKIYHKNVEP